MIDALSSIGDALATGFYRRALIEVVLVGALAGVVGVHVLLRRLPFFVVAMSHATFPGVVIASLLGISLFVGGGAFGLVVVAVVALVGRQRSLDDTSLIGVILAGSFALGVILLAGRPGSGRDLTAFLVGSVLTVTGADLVATAMVGTGVLAVAIVLHKELVLTAFDPGAAAALGYPLRRLDATALVLITLTLVVAVPAVGTLLAVALLCVPALTARVWTDRLAIAMPLAAALGAGCGVVGLAATAVWDVAAGGAVALTTAATFVVSLATRSAVSSALRSRAG